MSIQIGDIRGLLDGDDMDKLASLLNAHLGQDKTIQLLARLLVLVHHDGDEK